MAFIVFYLTPPRHIGNDCLLPSCNVNRNVLKDFAFWCTDALVLLAIVGGILPSMSLL